MCRGFKIDDVVVVFMGKCRETGNIWKLLSLLVNLNGFMSSVPSEDMADAKWLNLAMSMPM